MKDITTHDHVQRLCISIERRVRSECIMMIQPSGPHGASMKARQREEAAALKGLNRHLRECVSLVNNAKLDTTLYTPTRRGLRKVKPR